MWLHRGAWVGAGRGQNHHFAAMGEERATERLEDEEDGYEATEAWMNARGLESHDETGLAAALRASKGIA